MNVNYSDIALLDLIHTERLELLRTNLAGPWEELQRTFVGKGLRAYLLVALMKVHDALDTEPHDADVHRLQGQAKVLRELLRLMSPTGGNEMAKTVCDYVAQFAEKGK